MSCSAAISRSIASLTVTAIDHFFSRAIRSSASRISLGTKTLTATILSFPVAIATALLYIMVRRLATGDYQ